MEAGAIDGQLIVSAKEVRKKWVMIINKRTIKDKQGKVIRGNAIGELKEKVKNEYPEWYKIVWWDKVNE